MNGREHIKTLSEEYKLPSDRRFGERIDFLPAVRVAGRRVMPVGRYIFNNASPYKLATPVSMERTSDLIILAHGLPGDEWRVAAEKKLRFGIEADSGRAAFSLIPRGALLDAEERSGFGYNAEIPPAVRRLLTRAHPEHFDEPFSFGDYVSSMYAAFRLVRAHQDSERPPRVHLIGHSYGAHAVLYALSRAIKEKIPLPDTVSLLSPFVKIGTTEDRAIGLPRMQTRANAQKTLGHILQNMDLKYSLTPGRSPAGLHSNFFSNGYFRSLQNLQGAAYQTKVRVVLGENDDAIPYDHAEFIARLLGITAEKITTVLPEEDHRLSSLDLWEMAA